MPCGRPPAGPGRRGLTAGFSAPGRPGVAAADRAGVLLAAVGRPVAVHHLDPRAAFRSERRILPRGHRHHRMPLADRPAVRAGASPDHVIAAHGQEIALLRRSGSPNDPPVSRRRGASVESARRLMVSSRGSPAGMNIDKDQILQLLRSQGDDTKAQQADQELPAQVDTERDAGLLSKFGIDPMDLVKKLGGGGGLGGLLGGG